MKLFFQISICFVASLQAEHLNAQNDWISRLATEGKASWNRVSDRISRGFAIEVTDTQSSEPAGKVFISDQFALSIGKVQGEARTVAFGKNPEYIFRTELRSPNTGYTLIGLEATSENTRSGQLKQVIDSIATQYRNFHVSASGTATGVCSFLEVLDDPGFTIESAQLVPSQGSRRVLFEFAFDKAVSSLKDPKFPAKGSFVVDPERDWILIEYQWTLNKDDPDVFRLEVVNSDFQSIDGMELPGRVTYSISSADHPDEHGSKSFVYSDSFDKDECYVAHYGLPEPKGLTAGKTGWPFWMKIFLIGLALVIGATVFRKVQQAK